MPIQLDNISGMLDLNSPQRLKIAIVGEQKTGKTWFALSAPGPIFIADFDTRAESIKEYVRQNKRTDIYAKTYKDRDTKFPNAILDLETDIAAFEYAKTQGKEIPETYILDSITFMRTACERELVRQQPSMSRKIKLGNNELRIPQGWDIINGNRDYILFIIGRLAELGNVIAIFHEIDEKDVQNSTKDEKKYTGRKTIQPQYLSTLLSVFNDVFRITIDYNGNRIATVKPNSDFLASTSMNLDATEKPDIMQMIKKHEATK